MHTRQLNKTTAYICNNKNVNMMTATTEWLIINAPRRANLTIGAA